VRESDRFEGMEWGYSIVGTPYRMVFTLLLTKSLGLHYTSLSIFAVAFLLGKMRRKLNI
jgi:hypothetical protein